MRPVVIGGSDAGISAGLRARELDPTAKRVTVTDPAGAERHLGYDRLVIGTGAVRSARRSTGWTWTGCMCRTPWPTPAVMPTVDPGLGELLGRELGRHHVQVINDVTIKAIHQEGGALVVAGEPDFTAAADLALGTTAHKQGRIAGETVVGGTATFARSRGASAPSGCESRRGCRRRAGSSVA